MSTPEEGSLLWWIEQHRLRAEERDALKTELESLKQMYDLIYKHRSQLVEEVVKYRRIAKRCEAELENEREGCAKVADAETELPGDCPEYIRAEIEKLPFEEQHRLTVRLTKENIARKIRARGRL